MPKKETKRAQKEKPESKGISWKAVAAILGGITTFMGGVVSWLDFIIHVQSGYKIFLWAGIAVFVVVWFTILWLLYKQRNYYGYIWLAVTIVAGVSAWYGWTSYVHTREEKLIVLIANFDDTKDDYYALRNEIVEKLTADFAGDDSVSIETVNEIITPGSDSGSPRARELGKSYQADVVIWGWYRATENPNITIHVENLSPKQFSVLEESESFEPPSTLAELESFTFQQQLGSEASNLIAFLEGIIEYNAQDYAAAISLFDFALQGNPTILVDQASIYFYRANSYSYLEKPKKAILDFDQAILLDPRLADAYANRGNAYTALEQYNQAIDDYTKALQLAPQADYIFNNRGYTYLFQKEYKQAIADFTEGIRLKPDSFFYYHNRGVAYMISDQFTEAIADFTKALQLNPQWSASYRIRGFTYARAERYEEAIRDYNKLIELEPQEAEAYNYRGYIYYTLGQYQRAIIDLNQAIQIDPTVNGAYLTRGLIYVSLGQDDNAIADYGKAIEVDKNDAKAYYNRGNAYLRTQQFNLARFDFSQAIKIDPQLVEAYINLGNTYINLEQYNQAIFYFTEAIKLTSQNPDIFFNRGIAYFASHQYDLALLDITEAIQMNPQNAYYYKYRSEVYETLGKTIEAQADAAKYKEITGEDLP